ncbi:MAG: hypothetical protein AMXMBFR83_13120 [Phycisphaerae bacterium]
MTIRRTILISGIVFVVPALVRAQTYVQGGNALDANQRINSGGLNAPVRPYLPNAGNRIVSGNVAGGMSFRGYSPVQDPSTLFIRSYGFPNVPSLGGSTYGLGGLSSVRSGLPSDALTNFSRDSVSVADVRRLQLSSGLNRTPYYSPSSAVANTGAIVAGLNRPGSSQLISPYAPASPSLVRPPANPLSNAGGGGNALSVSPQLVRIDTGRPLTGEVNPRLLGSPLFGAARAVPVEALADQAQRGGGGALAANLAGRPLGIQLGWQEPDTSGNRPIQTPTGPPPDTEADETGPQSALRSPVGGSALAGVGTLRQPAGGLRNQPHPSPEQDIIAQTPTAGEQEPAAPASPEPAAPAVPLRSLVGKSGSAVNLRLGEGQEYLKNGQYYRAAEAFEMARLIEPANPLPLLGESLALLGAGEYMTSANYLFTGIRLYDSLARVRVDLNALIPDARMLENRRADLEKRLEGLDDFRLRFLLGYVEYSTGREPAGIANMERAVKELPSGFDVVRRFVEQLPRTGQTPTTRPATPVR